MDVRVAELAGRQFNRVSRRQLHDLGLSDEAIDYRVGRGRLVYVHEAVLAVAPVLDDPWGRWMGATLTEPGTVLSHASLAVAQGLWSKPPAIETVTRPGNGGPRSHDGLRVYRSTTLDGDTSELSGIPVTSVERLLLDLARTTTDRALARAIRESLRLERTTLHRIGDALGRYFRRRGSRRLAEAASRYSNLPISRARSGAEIGALEILRDDRRSMPNLNARIAGEEADLSWPRYRLIVEIDGGPFPTTSVRTLARRHDGEARAGPFSASTPPPYTRTQPPSSPSPHHLANVRETRP